MLGVANNVEVDLGQMARDRAKLKSALAAVSACTLSPAAAAGQVAAVAAGRQRLLDQSAGLGAPTAQAARIESLLRQALVYSIAADNRYRDWLGYLQGQARCSSARNQNFTAAGREDALATAAKQLSPRSTRWRGSCIYVPGRQSSSRTVQCAR